MPVKRLRTLEEAEDALVWDPNDPDLWRAIAGLWELSSRLCPPRLPPGVYKHRSIENLNRQREAWEEAAIRRQESRRAPRGGQAEGR